MVGWRSLSARRSEATNDGGGRGDEGVMKGGDGRVVVFKCEEERSDE